MIMMKHKKVCTFDFNNQYGWTLSQPIPYGEIEYVKDISMFTHDFVVNHDKFSQALIQTFYASGNWMLPNFVKSMQSFILM